MQGQTKSVCHLGIRERSGDRGHRVYKYEARNDLWRITGAAGSRGDTASPRQPSVRATGGKGGV